MHATPGPTYRSYISAHKIKHLFVKATQMKRKLNSEDNFSPLQPIELDFKQNAFCLIFHLV